MVRTALVSEQAVSYAASGLSGATQATRYVGGTTSGAPSSGTFSTGDWAIARNAHIWVCTAGGSPGTWADAGSYGSGGGTPATTVQTESGLDAGQVGTSTNYAREDHRHPITNLVDTVNTQTVGGTKTFSAGNSATTYGNVGTAAINIANTTAATGTNTVQAPGTLVFQGRYWNGSADTAGTAMSIGGTYADAAGTRRLRYTADNHAFAGTVSHDSLLTTTTGLALGGYGGYSIGSGHAFAPSAAATAGNPLVAPGRIEWTPVYWSGAASVTASAAWIGATVTDSAGHTQLRLAATDVSVVATATVSGLLTASGGVSIPSGSDLTVGTKATKTGTLSLPATVNTATVLGQFSSTNGSLALRFHMNFVTGTIQRSKTYEFVVDKTTDTTNTYYKLLPADQSTAQSVNSDFYLVCYRPSTATNTWQFWACTTTSTQPSTGTLTWSVESYGDSVVTYAAALSPATVNPTLPNTTLHPSNSLDTVAGNIGIGTDAPGAPLHLVATAGAEVLRMGASGGEVHLYAAGTTASGWSSSIPFGSSSGDAGIAATASLLLGQAGAAQSTMKVTGSDVLINDNGTARSIPRGYVGGVFATAGVGPTSSTTSLTIVTGTVPLVNGRRYRVHSHAYGCTPTVNLDRYQFDHNLTNATKIVAGANYYTTAGTAIGNGIDHESIWVATASGNATLSWTVFRGSGTGTLSISANASNPLGIWIEDIGV